MWLLNFLKVLFRVKQKWMKMLTQKISNWTPFQQITAHCPSVCFLVLFACTIPSVSSSSCVSAPAPQENLGSLATAINEFAIKLYKQMTANSAGNIFFSPLSISAAFQMIFFGTRGETSEELRKALGYKESLPTNEVIHATFHQLLCKLQLASNSSQERAMAIANALLLDADLAMDPDYHHSMEDLYQAEVQNVKFAVDSKSIAQNVNDWVNEKTGGMVEKLVDSLDSTSVLVVLNAVYFKGDWRYPFTAGMTKKATFFNDGVISKRVDVQMMRTRRTVRQGTYATYQALELPYRNSNASMLILLPQKTDGLLELEEKLTVEFMENILKEMFKHDVKVSLPKFKFEYTRELTEDLRALGASKIFNSESADFSGMTLSKNVYVTSAIQRAVIDVSETGTLAGAGTGIAMTGRSVPVTFEANHPFLFAIVDKTGNKNVILFMGRINSF